MTLDRRSFDLGTSGQAQSELAGVVARLETVIGQRSADVATAMSDFQADGVSEDYRHVEDRWNRASQQVRDIITLVKTTLLKNDETATTTLSRARTAVQNIG